MKLLQHFAKVLSFYIVLLAFKCNGQEIGGKTLCDLQWYFVTDSHIIECPDLSSCDLVCPMGLKTDSNECELCECNIDEPTTCPPLAVSCDLDCTNGFQTVEGCDICECKPPGNKGTWNVIQLDQFLFPHRMPYTVTMHTDLSTWLTNW